MRNQLARQGMATLPSLQEQLQNNPPEASAAAQASQPFKLGLTKPPKPAPRHLRHIAQLGTLAPELLTQLNHIVQKSMALMPKDRYQLVTDFANDLRQIARALSATQVPDTPPVPPIDPHSTQPDLPRFSHVPQAGKEQGKQDSGGSSADTQSTVPTAITCPRCGTSCAPKATFCPHCGTTLRTPDNQVSSNQQVQMHNAALPDITAEKTWLINSHAVREAVATHNAGRVQVQTSTTPTAYGPQYLSQSQQPQLQQLRTPAQSIAVHPEVHISSWQPIGVRGQNDYPQQMWQAKQQSSLTGLLLKYRILILGITLLILFLGIAFFLMGNLY